MIIGTVTPDGKLTNVLQERFTVFFACPVCDETIEVDDIDGEKIHCCEMKYKLSSSCLGSLHLEFSKEFLATFREPPEEGK